MAAREWQRVIGIGKGKDESSNVLSVRGSLQESISQSI